MKNKDMAVGMAWGLAVGVVTGAVAALLLAPASGSETRRRLLYERDHTLESARDKTRRAMAKLRRERQEEMAEGGEAAEVDEMAALNEMEEPEAVFIGA